MKRYHKLLLATTILTALIIPPVGTVYATQTAVQPPNGGTGLNTLPSYGQVLVGNSSSGYTLTATSSLGISSGSGAVTSVGFTAPTGLSISGSPITTSGTFGLTWASGYIPVLTASSTNWNSAYDGWNANNANWTTAYNDRLTTATYPLSISGTTISTVATSSLSLTTSSFASHNVSQWTNDAGYLTSLAGASFIHPFIRQQHLLRR